MSRRSFWPLLRLLFAIAALVLIGGRIVDWIVEGRWFDATGAVSQADYGAIYRRILLWRSLIGFIGALLIAIALGWNARVAIGIVRKTPAPLDLSDAQSGARRRWIPLEDKLQIDRFRPWILAAIIGIGAWGGGVWASGHWTHAARFLGAAPLRQADPYFGRDLSFYLFQLPFLNFVWSFLHVVLWMCIGLVTAIYVYEEVWPASTRHGDLSSPSLRHAAILIALWLIWKIPGYRLAVFNDLVTQRGAYFGVTWVDFTWRWPLNWASSALAIAAAIAVWHFARRDDVRRTLLCPAIFLVSVFVLDWLLPVIAQVTLTNPRREQPHRERHRRATLHAHRIDGVTTSIKPAAQSTAEAAQSTVDGSKVPQKRMTSRLAASTTGDNAAEIAHNRLQSTADGSKVPQGVMTIRNIARDDLASADEAAIFAGLPSWPIDALARQWNRGAPPNGRWSRPQIDRYRIAGRLRAVYIAARAPLPPINGTWRERHGIGRGAIRIADIARRDADNLPHIYFDSANSSTPSSNTNAPAPISADELIAPARDEILFGAFEAAPVAAYTDFPPPAANRNAPNSYFDPMRANRASQRNAAMSVGSIEPPYALLDADDRAFKNAGVALDGTLWRALTAWHLGDWNLLLSRDASARNRAAWHRSVVARCTQIAPWLLWSGSEPLPIVGRNRRLMWLLDGFSLATTYPLAQPLEGTNINSVRASVIATVDALSGATHFYRVDGADSDPQIDLYAQMFPEWLSSSAKMPAELRDHLRPSPRLAAARAEIWSRYGESDATEEANTRVLFRDAFDIWPSFLAVPSALPATLIAAPDARNLQAVSLALRPHKKDKTSAASRSATRETSSADIVALLFSQRDSTGRDTLHEWQVPRPIALSPMRMSLETGAGSWLRPTPITALSVAARGDCLFARDVRVDSAANDNARRGQKLSVVCAPIIATQSTVALRPLKSAPRFKRKPLVPAPRVAPENDAARRLNEARRVWRNMEKARRRGDWASYQNASRRLDQLLSDAAR